MTSVVLSSLSRRAPAIATRTAGAFASRGIGGKKTIIGSQQSAAACFGADGNVLVRTMVTRTLPTLSSEDLPYHIVMGMPALSPTMESGSLAEWYVKEGDSFIAGDALAKIETDKASIDFEAQDDGYVAKLLAEAGGSNEIKVGTPIMVTVEEADDVAAFANYTSPAEAPAAPVPPKVTAAATPPPPPPPPAAKATPPPTPEPVQQAPPPPPAPVVAAAAPAASPTPTSGWGSLAFVNSPLAKTLSKQQKAYVEKYGRTGQVPL